MTIYQSFRKGIDATVGLKRTNTVTEDHEIPNLAQVRSIAEGLASTKEAVDSHSDINVDIVTGGLLVVDGYQTLEGDRILLNNQDDPLENGIYNATVGVWVRTADADSQAELKPGSTVRVLSGNHSGRVYQLMNSTNPEPGVDIQNWAVIASSSDAASDVNVDDSSFTYIAGSDTQSVLDSIDDVLQALSDTRTNSRYESSITTLTSGVGVTFNHALGKRYLPSVKVFDSVDGSDITSSVTIEMTDENNLKVTNDAADIDVVLSAMK